jgi:CoA-transferase family III
MGLGSRDRRVIPTALADVIADEARAVTKLAKALGTDIAIDPVQLLRRDIALQPPTHWSPNRHCQLIETSDGWIAVNLAREDDRDAVPAWLECDAKAEPWDTVVDMAKQRTAADLIERAILLGMPVAAVGETPSSRKLPPTAIGTPRKRFSDMAVVDLSALWAGPYCGALLAEAGMAVTKFEDPNRPDPTRNSTPEHHRRINGGKRSVSISMSDPALLDRIANADVLITNARPHALARLGLTPDELFARNPGLIWVAITAHGFTGPNAMRVGFGDDCAAAGGLVSWNDRKPSFLGDALADPLTGLRAARRVLEHVAAGQSGLIDVALATTASDFAQQAGLRSR